MLVGLLKRKGGEMGEHRNTRGWFSVGQRKIGSALLPVITKAVFGVAILCAVLVYSVCVQSG